MTRPTLLERRIHLCRVAAAGGAIVLGLSYIVLVRTRAGQSFDDLAFDGRAVEDPEITRLTNDLLHSVTRATLFLLTAALVVLALARRRLGLAIAVGVAVTASVVTTEVLKLRVLDRPALDDVAGIAQNSLPSGHATIGMALSLGLIMVTPHRSRWLALIVALSLSTSFGIGVLATGWHRPSDTLAAYAVCVTVFSLVTAASLARSGRIVTELGEVERRLSTVPMIVSGFLAVGAIVFLFVASLRHDDWRTVDYSVRYVAVCGVLIVTAAAVVIGYHQLLRGLSLGAPPVGVDGDAPAEPVEADRPPRRR